MPRGHWVIDYACTSLNRLRWAQFGHSRPVRDTSYGRKCPSFRNGKLTLSRRGAWRKLSVGQPVDTCAQLRRSLDEIWARPRSWAHARDDDRQRRTRH